MKPIERFDQIALLDGEIALLRDVMDANQRALTSYYPPAKEGYQQEELNAYLACLDAGISEWDAEHPCRAIEAREALIREAAPDLVLREMGAPTLPGIPA